jgi:hypothetical protein
VDVPLSALRERLPGLAGDRLEPIADGWDSEVLVGDPALDFAWLPRGLGAWFASDLLASGLAGVRERLW